jgi:hypothetical protein
MRYVKARTGMTDGVTRVRLDYLGGDDPVGTSDVAVRLVEPDGTLRSAVSTASALHHLQIEIMLEQNGVPVARAVVSVAGLTRSAPSTRHVDNPASDDAIRREIAGIACADRIARQIRAHE